MDSYSGGEVYTKQEWYVMLAMSIITPDDGSAYWYWYEKDDPLEGHMTTQSAFEPFVPEGEFADVAAVYYSK